MRKWKLATPVIGILPPPPTGEGEADKQQQDELQEWVSSVYEDRSSDRLNDESFNIRALSSDELRSIILIHRTQTHRVKKRAAEADDEYPEMDAKRKKIDDE